MVKFKLYLDKEKKICYNQCSVLEKADLDAESAGEYEAVSFEPHPNMEVYVALLKEVPSGPVVGVLDHPETIESIRTGIQAAYGTSVRYAGFLTKVCYGFEGDVKERILTNWKESKLSILPIVKAAFHRLYELRQAEGITEEQVLQMKRLAEILANYLEFDGHSRVQLLSFFEAQPVISLDEKGLKDLLGQTRLTKKPVNMQSLAMNLNGFINRDDSSKSASS